MIIPVALLNKNLERIIVIESNNINFKYYYLDDVKTNIIGIEESKDYCRPLFYNSEEKNDPDKMVSLRRITTERGEKIIIDNHWTYSITPEHKQSFGKNIDLKLRVLLLSGNILTYLDSVFTNKEWFLNYCKENNIPQYGLYEYLKIRGFKC